MSAGDLSRMLDEFEIRLRMLEGAPIAVDMVTDLAGVWYERADKQVGVDTGQTKRRTKIKSITGSGAKASALLESDTPYAGFHNYGTSRTAPNRYWSDGMADAERVARDELGSVVFSEIGRVLASGGVWNPRRIR